jgi:hypothetical protein
LIIKGLHYFILGALLFLIFINDIADDMLGLCRLFADDTPVGERSLEINNGYIIPEMNNG